MKDVYQVKVITRARGKSVERIGDVFKVRVNTTPVDGKANQAVLALLAKYFQVKKSQVSIIKGFASHNKLIEISNE